MYRFEKEFVSGYIGVRNWEWKVISICGDIRY